MEHHRVSARDARKQLEYAGARSRACHAIHRSEGQTETCTTCPCRRFRFARNVLERGRRTGDSWNPPAYAAPRRSHNGGSHLSSRRSTTRYGISARTAKNCSISSMSGKCTSPPHTRKWGYYTLPILYGDQLVARIAPASRPQDPRRSTWKASGWSPRMLACRHDAFISRPRTAGLTRLCPLSHRAERIDTSAACANLMPALSRNAG